MQMITRKKAVGWFINLCILLAVAYALSRISGCYFEKTNAPLVQELQRQLLLFAIPAGDTEREPIEVVNHGGPIAVVRYLQSTRAGAEIAVHYRSQLEAQGWKLVESDEEGSAGQSFKYCRNATGFDFSVWKYAGKTGYRIALLRNGNNSGAEYCSDKR